LNPTKLSPKRKKAAEQRLKEFPDQEFWRQVFSKIPKTPFLRGENDRKWKASFDWLLRPDSATKVMEGFYGKTDAEVNPLSEPPPHRDIFANYKPRGDNAI
jgi:hypothetical protein